MCRKLSAPTIYAPFVRNQPLLAERKHIQMYNNPLCHRDKLSLRLFCITVVSSTDHSVISASVVTSVVQVQVIHLLAGTMTFFSQIFIATSQHVIVTMFAVVVSSILRSVISACCQFACPGLKLILFTLMF